ncbi:MAG: hypothetical protein WDA65_01850 [Christensenellales bacterium]
MKKIFCLGVVLLTAILCACGTQFEVSTTLPAYPAPEATLETAVPFASSEPTAPPSAGPETAGPEASPEVTGPKMYSSYAYLVSFDPDTGLAQFDYFGMLRGEEAVNFLVERKGYSEAEARAIVDDFGDSEFVEKNLNKQLRAVDINTVSLSLMYQPSGAVSEDMIPIPSTASDFMAVYAHDPSLLTSSFFYYIHVANDGHVFHVEQVYWP